MEPRSLGNPSLDNVTANPNVADAADATERAPLPHHLRDFTASARMLVIAGLAVAIGLASAVLAWALLRQWSGDDAYERYLAHHQLVHPDQPLLSRRAFIRRYQHERFSSGPNRCC